jgi:hypothetical protein
MSIVSGASDLALRTEIDRLLEDDMRALVSAFVELPMESGDVTVVQPHLLQHGHTTVEPYRIVQRAVYMAGHTTKIMFIPCGDKVVFLTSGVPDGDAGFGAIMHAPDFVQSRIRALYE